MVDKYSNRMYSVIVLRGENNAYLRDCGWFGAWGVIAWNDSY